MNVAEKSDFPLAALVIPPIPVLIVALWLFVSVVGDPNVHIHSLSGTAVGLAFWGTFALAMLFEAVALIIGAFYLAKQHYRSRRNLTAFGFGAASLAVGSVWLVLVL